MDELTLGTPKIGTKMYVPLNYGTIYQERAFSFYFLESPKLPIVTTGNKASLTGGVIPIQFYLNQSSHSPSVLGQTVDTMYSRQ